MFVEQFKFIVSDLELYDYYYVQKKRCTVKELRKI